MTVETRVTNQRGQREMTFRRTALVPKKTHAVLGEGKLAASRARCSTGSAS